MSLAIDLDEVTAVLLADGWHEVANRSYSMDSYEYIWAQGGSRDNPMIIHGGGQSGITAIGFEFTDTNGHRIAGPLSAILAVRREPHESVDDDA